MSYVIIEAAGGVIQLVTTNDPDLKIVQLDFDEFDPHYDSITDPTTVYENIETALNELRDAMLPSPARARIRRDIVDRWHDFDYVVRDGIAMEREKVESTNLVRRVDNIHSAMFDSEE